MAKIKRWKPQKTGDPYSYLLSAQIAVREGYEWALLSDAIRVADGVYACTDTSSINLEWCSADDLGGNVIDVSDLGTNGKGITATYKFIQKLWKSGQSYGFNVGELQRMMTDAMNGWVQIYHEGFGSFNLYYSQDGHTFQSIGVLLGMKSGGGTIPTGWWCEMSGHRLQVALSGFSSDSTAQIIFDKSNPASKPLIIGEFGNRIACLMPIVPVGFETDSQLSGFEASCRLVYADSGFYHQNYLRRVVSALSTDGQG